MNNLSVTISIKDSELDDQQLQAYTQTLLPQIREFDGIEDADLVSQELPVEDPDGSAGDLSAGAITFTSTVEALPQIVDWIEKQWLEQGESSPRKMLVEVTTPDEFKFAYTAHNQEELQAFLEQVNRALNAGDE